MQYFFQGMKTHCRLMNSVVELMNYLISPKQAAIIKMLFDILEYKIVFVTLKYLFRTKTPKGS